MKRVEVDIFSNELSNDVTAQLSPVVHDRDHRVDATAKHLHGG